jgi:thermitase
MKEMNVAPKREIRGIRVHLVKLPPGLSVEQAIERFSRLPGVEFAEPNYILHVAEATRVEIIDQWGLSRIHTEEAWNTLSGNQRNEVLLATVDTGVQKDRSDLSSRIWVFPGETPGNGIDDDNNGHVDDTWGWDFVNNDNDPTDDHMHGTAVTSVMAAAQDGAGMVGICPWCRVMAVKVMDSQGSGSLDVVASGIVYAAQNEARVINLSLGGASGSQTLENAVNFAWDQGAVVVAAAGNNGNNTILYPAGYANAISVGSTNSGDKHSWFSNYRAGYVSVAAPGEAIYVIDINDPAPVTTITAAPHLPRRMLPVGRLDPREGSESFQCPGAFDPREQFGRSRFAGC